LTVTVTGRLFTVLQPFVTCTQYVVVDAGETLIDADTAPMMGEVVFTGVPMYHWYDGEVPATMTLSCELLPWLIVAGDAIASCENDGGTHVELTVTVTALLSTGVPQLDMRTQYVVVDVGETVMDEELVPVGDDVMDGVPMYH
jgi:hypothetical protein